MRLISAAPVALYLWMLCTPQASPARELDKEALALSSLAAYAVSPDGARLASVRCPERVVGNRGCEIFVRPTSGNQTPALVGDHQAAWSPSWSPDGRFLAYYAMDDGLGGVWVLDTADGSRRALWHAPSPDHSLVDRGALPRWTNDGHALLLMHADVSSYAPNTQSTDIVRVKHSYSPEHPPVWAEGAGVGKVRLFSAVRLEFPAAGLQPRRSKSAELRLEGIPTSAVQFSSDGLRVAYLEGTELPMAAMRRARYGVAHKLVVGQLLTGTRHVIAQDVLQYIGKGDALRWSPDDRWIAFASGDRFVQPPADFYNVAGDLFVVPSDGSAPAARINGTPGAGISVGSLSLLVWTRDSKYLAARTGEGLVWLADMHSRRMRKLDAGPLAHVVAPAMDTGRPDVVSVRQNALMLFGVTDKDHDGYVHLAPLSGERGRALYRAPVSFQSIVPEQRVPRVNARTGRVYFVQESTLRDADLWSADLRLREVRQETSVGTSLPVPLRSEVISYRDRDGRPLRSAVLYPAAYDPARRYPAVLWVYPNGPGSFSVHRYHAGGGAGFELEQLALHGYMVVSPDMPCPPGRATEYLDIAAQAAADALVAKGLADAQRIGVMGSSGGGYATIALLSTSQRWRVGVMNAGYGDPTDLWGSIRSDQLSGWANFMPLMEFWSGAAPWEAPEAYMRDAPLYHLDKVKAPILMQTGLRDEPFHYSSNVIYAGLIRAGHGQVTSLVYPNEGHYVGDVRAHRDYWSRVIAFLDANL